MLTARNPASDSVRHFVTEGSEQAKGVHQESVVEEEDDHDVDEVERQEEDLGIVHV